MVCFVRDLLAKFTCFFVLFFPCVCGIASFSYLVPTSAYNK